eukprot:scaffold155074_cov21-Tisochrysis_lutea.AAC.2
MVLARLVKGYISTSSPLCGSTAGQGEAGMGPAVPATQCAQTAAGWHKPAPGFTRNLVACV